MVYARVRPSRALETGCAVRRFHGGAEDFPLVFIAAGEIPEFAYFVSTPTNPHRCCEARHSHFTSGDSLRLRPTRPAREKPRAGIQLSLGRASVRPGRPPRLHELLARPLLAHRGAGE